MNDVWLSVDSDFEIMRNWFVGFCSIRYGNWWRSVNVCLVNQMILPVPLPIYIYICIYVLLSVSDRYWYNFPRCEFTSTLRILLSFLWIHQNLNTIFRSSDQQVRAPRKPQQLFRCFPQKCNVSRTHEWRLGYETVSWKESDEGGVARPLHHVGHCDRPLQPNRCRVNAVVPVEISHESHREGMARSV